MKKNAFVMALVALGMMPLAAARAQVNADVGLYDPLPPEGSAFVRFASDYERNGSYPVKANGKVFDYLDFKEISSYFVLPKGEMQTQIGDVSKTFNIESGKFYTVILGDDNQLKIKDDPQNDNQAKAQVILYNLSGEGDVSLRTADGKVEVVPPLAPGESNARQINPVKVPLAVFKGDKKLKDLGEVSLERSRSYGAFVMKPDNVEWIRSSTNVTR